MIYFRNANLPVGLLRFLVTTAMRRLFGSFFLTKTFAHRGPLQIITERFGHALAFFLHMHFFRLFFLLQPQGIFLLVKTNMYSAETTRYRERSLLNRLKPENTKIAGPPPTIRKKYRDWTGKYFKLPPVKTENAYNRPLKKVVYDTWGDTRGVWLTK